jgi:hypothetical protein
MRTGITAAAASSTLLKFFNPGSEHGEKRKPEPPMKNFACHVLRKLVRFLAPRVGLVVVEYEPDNSPEAVAFLAEEQPADWEFYGITLH